MNEAYLNINNVPTKVITWGKWVEENFKENEPKDIVICIPGNPGVTKFYTAFLQTVYEKVGFPVWIIGHAGHEHPHNKNNIYDIPPLKENERLYSLQGQIDHKIAFIEKYVPKDARIHFIGHSIGAQMILKLLEKPSINNRVVNNYLLFPTLEYMAETRNGIFLTKMVVYFVWLLLWLSWFYTYLPIRLQTLLVYIYTKLRCIPRMHFKTIWRLVNPDTLDKIFFMAFDEMEMVKERNNDVIIANKEKIRFYYGASDGWVPIEYYKKLKIDIPGVNAEVCVRNFPHAFVLSKSRDVGNMVSSWICK